MSLGASKARLYYLWYTLEALRLNHLYRQDIRCKILTRIYTGYYHHTSPYLVDMCDLLNNIISSFPVISLQEQIRNLETLEPTHMLLNQSMFRFFCCFVRIPLKKSLMIPKGKSESVYRSRTNNTMAKRNSTKGQTMIYKAYT
jgi:hypothetical protein